MTKNNYHQLAILILKMNTSKPLTFAQSYILASKVRSKLTKEAQNPNSSLRVLVTQANMLDNLMDHINSETEKRTATSKVQFQLPNNRPRQPSSLSANISEYEVDSDSDSDSDSDDSDYESDSDDYYYSSEEEEDEEEEQGQATLQHVQSYKQLKSLDLSLSSIREESTELPELSRSLSVTDSESEESDNEDEAIEFLDMKFNKNKSSLSINNPSDHHHHIRHNAIYSMEHVF